jgi:methionyl-tRNA synthetase
MIEKYCGGTVPQSKQAGEHDEDLREIATTAASKVEKYMDKFAFQLALEEIWVLVRRTNKYIDETAPWVLAKDESSKDRLDTVMHNLAESLRIISVLIYPFMHTTSEKIRTQLGITDAEVLWEDAFVFEKMNGEQVKKGDALFPRIDVEKELDALELLKESEAQK